MKLYFTEFILIELLSNFMPKILKKLIVHVLVDYFERQV